jgi:hypothetical protein
MSSVRGKRLARRLALYLTSIGIPAATSSTSYRLWAATLQAQYMALPEDQRTLARARGWKLITESASLRAAAATLVSPLCLQVQAGKPSASHGLSRQAIFALISQRWSPLTPPCPTCRMSGGFPKRSWPSREWAEEVLARQHDRDTLCLFECPVQPGFWHLGHVRRQTAAQNAPKKTFISAQSIPTNHTCPI